MIYLPANELHHLPRNLAPLSIGRLDLRNSLLVTLLGDYGGIISCEIAPLAARSPDGGFKTGLPISHLTCSLVFFFFCSFCWCVVFVFFLLRRTPVSDGAQFAEVGNPESSSHCILLRILSVLLLSLYSWFFFLLFSLNFVGHFQIGALILLELLKW